MTNLRDDSSDLAERFPLDGHAGPATRLPAGRAQAMIDQALDNWQRDPGPLGRPRFRRSAWAAAGAVVLLGGAAAASLLAVRQPEPTPHSSAITTAGQSPAEARSPVSRHLPAGEPVEDDNDAEETVVAPPPKARGKAPAETSAPPQPPNDSPEDWMKRASRLRSEGKWARAEAAYRRVYQSQGSSLSAYVARVAAASLRLDHLGDPSGARRLFQSALRARPGGALDIEVRQGIADASRRLGDHAGEVAALEGLISAHPSSRAAQNARRRLEGAGTNAE